MRSLQGLGFTVTSRDVETGLGERVFYLKTVMVNGAAAFDGRLRRGDRLIKVSLHIYAVRLRVD